MSSSNTTTYPTYVNFLIHCPAPHVLHVEINRPSKLNAFNDAMFRELLDIFSRIRLDGDVRAVVLTGAGEKAFTAGLDLKDSFGTLGGGAEGVDSYRKTRGIREKIKQWQEALGAVEGCGKPTISLLHGISYGLALDLTCCTDIRLCTSSVALSLKEVDIGLAADLGTLTRLPKLVRSLSWVKEIAYTARIFSGREALAQGFVSHVVETKQEGVEKALEIAKAITEKSPVAVESTKELIEWGLGRPMTDGLRYTQVWNAPAILAGDVREAVGATLQRRKPRFEKL
ncbi:ClpP/crotonase-like domain-containing protein [Kalaharituber pfeilii]|nr:ClpP/crotonase-like domain-containing protein [Kalaharituber pfeilii]